MLKCFWIRFRGPYEEFYSTGGFDKGFGVTAFDLDDAKNLLRSSIFGGERLPEIDSVIEDVAYDQLEEEHVKMNMGIMVERGVWFPKAR